MLDIAGQIRDELVAGRSVVVATVSQVSGSAPRAFGSAMALTEDDRVIGSISGGCVEAEVYELAGLVRESGVAEETAFGFSDEQALRAGLSCGGAITVLVRRIDPDEAELRAELDRAAGGGEAALAVVAGEDEEAAGAVVTSHGASGAEVLGASATARIRAELQARRLSGRPGRATLECDGRTLGVVFLVQAPPPRLIIFGAVDFAAALADAAAPLGYRITVCDPREPFATPARFPGAHEVVVRWPHEYLAETETDDRTVLCALTHDAKFDIPLLTRALAQPAAYIGAMGSRRTHERRLRLLREAGVDEAALSRLRSPIGLDIGGATPEETAISILAEVIAVRTGASAHPLSQGEGPIHARMAE